MFKHVYVQCNVTHTLKMGSLCLWSLIDNETFELYIAGNDESLPAAVRSIWIPLPGPPEPRDKNKICGPHLFRVTISHQGDKLSSFFPLAASYCQKKLLYGNV